MKVLLWDDEPVDREQLVLALQNNGHEVTATSSEDEFRRHLGQPGWDLVVLDLLTKDQEDQDHINLKETRGYELAREVRKRDKSVLISLITKYLSIPELGLERLGEQVFLDQKRGLSWLVLRLEQVHKMLSSRAVVEREREDLVREKEALMREMEGLKEQLAWRLRIRRSIAFLSLLLVVGTLLGSLLLPDEAAGTAAAKVLLVLGLAVCGASGAAIADSRWPRRRDLMSVLSEGAAVGLALGLTYLVPIQEAADNKFPSRRVVFVGALVAFFLGVASKPGIERIRARGKEYIEQRTRARKSKSEDL